MSSCKKQQVVKISERGQRIGEDAAGAVMLDHDAELMRQMHEEFPRAIPSTLAIGSWLLYLA